MSTLHAHSRFVQAATACLVGLASLVAPACREQPQPESPSESVQASAERDGASLVATADRASLHTVDRLTLTVRAAAPAGQVVRSLSLDPESAGWTVVSRAVPATALDSTGRSVRTDTLVLEPFLEGDYTIPPIAASFAVPGDPASTTLSTTPIAIRVDSVLPEDAVLDELAAPAGPVNPPPLAPQPVSPWVYVGVAATLFVALAFAVRLARARREPEPDPQRELELLRAYPAKTPTENRDRLAAILRRACESHASASLAQLLARLDAERYAPPSRRPTEPIDREIDWALQALRTSTPGSPNAAAAGGGA